MPLPPLKHVLDPRRADVAMSQPIADSVNIPVYELADRVHELPDMAQVLQIANFYEAQECLQFFSESKREIQLVEPVFSEKFEPGRLWSPSPSLEELAPTLTPGTAFDLGCGAGRNAAYLASLGWQVLAIDRFPSALTSARKLIEQYSDSRLVERLEGDFEKQALSEFSNGKKYDLVLSMMSYHKIQDEQIVKLLNPEGSWLVESYTAASRRETGKPKSPLLVFDQDGLPPGLKVLESKVFGKPQANESEADGCPAGERIFARIGLSETTGTVPPL